MQLSSRQARRGDFDAFYCACFARRQGDAAHRAIVWREWQVFLDNPATLSMLSTRA